LLSGVFLFFFFLFFKKSAPRSLLDPGPDPAAGMDTAVGTTSGEFAASSSFCFFFFLFVGQIVEKEPSRISVWLMKKVRHLAVVAYMTRLAWVLFSSSFCFVFVCFFLFFSSFLS
jgi:hypothetical protein